MAFRPPPRSALGADIPGAHPSAGMQPIGSITPDEAFKRSNALFAKLPPMSGTCNFKRAWGIDESLEQHQCLMRQHEQQTAIGQNHVVVRKMQTEFAQLVSQDQVASVKRALDGANNGIDAAPLSSETLAAFTQRLNAASANLRLSLRKLAVEKQQAAEKAQRMEEEIHKSNQEMVAMREAIDDVSHGGGPRVIGLPSPADDSTKERKYFYCSDCHVGGHGNRFCTYFLKRPNWRVYPSEKWFEDKNGSVSFCPLGRWGVDFTDETHFSSISMHLKGRIWLEDKRKLYEFVPDLMPLTFVIEDQKWVGPQPPLEPPGAPPMPWFVKETDRNWGTSVVCCARPEDCMGLAKPNAVYVVQKHIPKPLLYYNGEKCHIKFYNLFVGLADGVTWHLYTYSDGYLSISPKKWTPDDLSKETQVTIIRSKRIKDWPYWEKVYEKCQQGIATVLKRAAEQGKLEGRNKKQFEIISADYIVTEDLSVYLLEFNSGPVLKDPDDSPDVHDAGMVTGALHIVEPWEGGDKDLWDFVTEVKGVPVQPDDRLGAA